MKEGHYKNYTRVYALEPNFAPDPDGQSDYDNPYLFTGRRLDILDSGSLKIQYNRNRYYDPHSGRWLTHDPLGITPNPQPPNIFDTTSQYKDSLSLYEYVKSNPVIKVDPEGLYSCGNIPGTGLGIPNIPESWYGGYDWLNPRGPDGKLKCEPCRWRNKANTTSRYYESGCYSTTVTMPIGPGAGAGLILFGVTWQAFNPSMVLCNGPLVEGFTCQCRLYLKRKCFRKCCNRYRTYTETKTICKSYIRYGEAYRPEGLRKLICSCSPYAYWHPDRQGEYNKALKCE